MTETERFVDLEEWHTCELEDETKEVELED